MNIKDILYTVEKKDLDIMLCSIYSLIKNNKVNKIRLHIVCKDFEQKDFDKLYTFLSRNGIVMHHIYPMGDFSKYLNGLDGKDIRYAKIFYPNIIKEAFDIHNLLYLDNATIVTDNLNNLDMYKNEIVNAVPATVNRSYKEKMGLHDYYDTSVLYINLDKWSKKGIEERVKIFTEKNNKKLKYQEQDIINGILNGYIRELPLKYNVNAYPYFFNDEELKVFYQDKDINIRDVEKAKINPIIVHIDSLYGINPWHKNNVNPFNASFREIMEEVNNDFKLIPYKGIKLLAYNKAALKKKILKDKQKTK